MAGADGIHLGQTDLSPLAARQILGPDRIIGVSTHCLSDARQALRDGADYIGVGPMFPTTTKQPDFIAGPKYAREVARRIALPGVAIGGITPDNAAEVARTGLQAIAVTQAVLCTNNPQLAARKLKRIFSAISSPAKAPK